MADMSETDQIEQCGVNLFECIAQNDLTRLQSFLEKYPDAIECLDAYSNTPLLYACFRGFSEIVMYLLACGADYKRINIFGQNALNLAIYSGDRASFNAVLLAGNFTEFNSNGILTPLCVAALQRRTELAEIILSLETPTDNHAVCSSRSIHGVCPLQLAHHNNDIEMIELLKPTHQMHLAPQIN